ncbi:MAG: hypothetical protein KAU62_11730 [Candidatus Heimdallarchaeota archaeon]|nr:hypothetical protein [Candidatus Heimdallarchaeota archaeon]MCG3256753.1 hypothetical protein [Candidatus Heimdallarchaeota archaeon]MCK4611817.1 hypothetical protein [Candidatus Heimdallarchaeota archaeon]
MKINQDHLEEVGDLVDIHPNDIKQKKRTKLHGYLIHYLVQVFVLLLSSLMGYLFVLWEHSDRSGYPYSSFTPFLRHTYLGPIVLLNLQGGNAVQSYFQKKKYNLHSIAVYPVILANLILSFFSFFMIFYKIYQEPFYGFGVIPAYGVFEKGKSKKFRKIMEK